ncbi:poly-beta-hydroxybutyrate polymerase [Rhodoferax koreense]|uniref:Poly-beta-hydroxybutyrate polymerase n=1 Tax=Rhodoferax koreensis TaxID=1842727 RepID=A0A1P8JU11_9BURK|nr:alpha/beta fold hydrolase [Rhodoferax koreense]APW37256.1 poly-beta-hydroxybutyrate polymerase [Rhodoferax koreense]
MLAYLDWLLHLAISPGRQLALAEEARQALLQWLPVAPPAQEGQPASAEDDVRGGDRRFDDPAWNTWPFDMLKRGFLLGQRWWQSAATGVRGVSRHHEDVVAFGARQWLDTLSPSNFLWTNPQALRAVQQERGQGLARGMLNLMDDAARLGGGTPPGHPSRFRPGHELAATPGKVVFRNHLIELLQYSPVTETVFPEPVLIVPSWIMKYYILDLSPQNSLVRYLVSQGYTVFMVSWRNPGAEDRALDMADYLALGPVAAMDAVAELQPGRKVHAAGYCLGGTLLAIAAAAWAREGRDSLASLTLLATQTDFEEPGELSLFIDDSQITYLEDMMWQTGYLDGPQMGASFTYLNTRDLLWSRMVRDYLLGARLPPNDLTAWNLDTTRMPYQMHVQYLKSLYRDNALARGAYQVGDHPVALSDLDVPVFAVGTLKDHISPWRSVYKLHLLTDAELSFVLTSGGHNAGILSEPGHAGRSYRIHGRPRNGKYLGPEEWLAQAEEREGSWWPAWQAWLAERSGPRTAPPPMCGVAGMGRVLRNAPGEYVLQR